MKTTSNLEQTCKNKTVPRKCLCPFIQIHVFVNILMFPGESIPKKGFKKGHHTEFHNGKIRVQGQQSVFT